MFVTNVVPNSSRAQRHAVYDVFLSNNQGEQAVPVIAMTPDTFCPDFGSQIDCRPTDACGFHGIIPHCLNLTVPSNRWTWPLEQPSCIDVHVGSGVNELVKAK